MAKVNISLVGKQTFPIYAQALDCDPDILVLLHSRQTEKMAQIIKYCIHKKRPMMEVIPQEIDTENLGKSHAQLQAVADRWSRTEHSVVVNVTGGTKPWSMQMQNIFSGRDNVQCVYIDQRNRIWDMNTYNCHTFKLSEADITIDDMFAIYGVDRTTRHDISEYTEEDMRSAAMIEKLYRCNSTALHNIVTQIKQAKEAAGVFNSRDNFIEVLSENEFKCHVVNFNNERWKVDASIASPHAASLLLNTGWFELKVADILRRWPSARKVWVNTEVNLVSTNPDNEIDIIVETVNDKLLFVECKTRISNSTDINKFKDVTQNIGGLGSKHIFVTYYPLDPAKVNDAAALKKLENRDIRAFSTYKIEKTAGGYNSFYASLDDYLTTINA